MHFIVVGSTGFIGSRIYTSLKLDPKNQVTGISSSDIDLSCKHSFEKLKNIILSGSIIIMCAGVKKQLGDNIDIFEKNLIIIKNFIKAVKISKPKKIIFFSSASIYGEDVFHSGKINEKTQVDTRSYYGIAKYTSELLLSKICDEIKIELLILRPPLIYGSGDLSYGYGPTGFLRNALDGNEIKLWGDGTELREFIYINDAVELVIKLIYKDFNGVLNLASGQSYSYIDIVRIIKDLLGHDIKISSQKRSKAKVDHVFSNEMIKNVTNNFSFTPLEFGIRSMLDSMFKENP